jgi:prephenate dehydrogenase
MEMEADSNFRQLCLVGTGLMGSSFSLAMKSAGLVERVIGYDSSRAACELALSLGYIDEIAPSIAEAAQSADLIILAIPVAAMSAAMLEFRQGLSKSCSTLIMDLGSTKAQIAHSAEAILQEHLSCFVPAHPICGREVSGCANAQADLYVAKRVVLCPLPGTSREHVRRAKKLWASLGCTLTEMTPEEHDASYAAVSHLPHLLAFAYVESIRRQESMRGGGQNTEVEAQEVGDLHTERDGSGATATEASQLSFSALAGSGFRDFTRISASNPVMWRDILLANREEVLLQTRLFRASLGELEQCLRENKVEELEELIRSASDFRTDWSIKNSLQESGRVSE